MTGGPEWIDGADNTPTISTRSVRLTGKQYSLSVECMKSFYADHCDYSFLFLRDFPLNQRNKQLLPKLHPPHIHMYK